jgi:hypothetical protein
MSFSVMLYLLNMVMYLLKQVLHLRGTKHQSHACCWFGCECRKSHSRRITINDYLFAHTRNLCFLFFKRQVFQQFCCMTWVALSVPIYILGCRVRTATPPPNRGRYHFSQLRQHMSPKCLLQIHAIEIATSSAQAFIQVILWIILIDLDSSDVSSPLNN